MNQPSYIRLFKLILIYWPLLLASGIAAIVFVLFNSASIWITATMINNVLIDFPALVAENDKLLVNEIAPRFHNSGHLTIEAFNISQFENHVRAVCNLESLPIKKISNAEMYNVLGFEIQKYKKRNYKKNEFFYDYQKKKPRDGRKMGHLTVLKD